jgi:hypothetical protein
MLNILKQRYFKVNDVEWRISAQFKFKLRDTAPFSKCELTSLNVSLDETKPKFVYFAPTEMINSEHLSGKLPV